MRIAQRFAAAALCCSLVTVTSLAADFQAGVARVDITPTKPVHLGGYASRTAPFKTVGQRIYVKALALRDAQGQTTLLLTADTIGTPRWFNDQLAERIAKDLGIPRERFLFACSHSHSTPAIRGALDIAYGLTGEAVEAVDAYSAEFIDKCFSAAEQSLKQSEPVKISFGRGEAHFAMNRRQFGKNGVSLGVNPNGVVDKDVPVLRVQNEDGSNKAIVFGYACHCTTLGATDELSGDWAGHAQDNLERAYPGAAALFITGCGADANPYPRQTPQYAYETQHGLALAGAVARVLNEPMLPVRGAISAAFGGVDLPHGPRPTRAQLEQMTTNSNPALVRFGRHYVGVLDQGKELPANYPCPVQVLRFGDGFTLIGIGGEVVADYSFRLRRELPGERLWTAGYCNDVFAYVPSTRILIEGGYEADTSMIYYGLPTRFAPEVEDVLIGKVLALVKQTQITTKP